MLVLRILIGLGLAYLVLLLLAWLFQDRLAFPAPRARMPDPKRVGVENGERVELVSGDGTKLVGWYLRAVDLHRPSPPSPALLWFYGNGETVAAIWPVVREFQPPGTAVLVLDYPGYGGSGGRATEGALYAAADAAYAALRARPDVDRQRLYGYGRSLGGAEGPLADKHREQPVPRGLEAVLGLVTRAEQDALVAVGELGALRVACGRSTHHDERAGHFAKVHIRVSTPGDEQLLEQRQAAF